jgi:ribosomal protein L40E
LYSRWCLPTFSFTQTHAFVQFLCMRVFHRTSPFFLSCRGCQQQQLRSGTVAVKGHSDVSFFKTLNLVLVTEFHIPWSIF